MKKKYLSMQEIQGVSLEVLKDITDLMDSNGFEYILAYGTLLGAIRHKGFIPWDDDIDIMMPRPDYENFLKYTSENKVKLGHLEVFNMDNNPNYPYMITRISDSRYEIDVENEAKCGLGIFVDVYPLDGIGATEEEGRNLLLKTCKYPSLIFLATRKYYHFGNTKGWLKRLIKIPAFIYTHIMGRDYFVRKLNRIVKPLDYQKSRFVGCAAWTVAREIDVFDKTWINDRIKCPFEKYDFYIPREYDKMLSITYGDYMQLPPEEDRVYHHMYLAYEKK